MADGQDQIRGFRCNQCTRETKHFMRGYHSTRSDDEESGTYFLQEALIIECCGCEHLAFVKRAHFSEHVTHSWHAATGNEQAAAHWEETIYPPVTYRAPPQWFEDLPDATLRIISREIYTSLQTGSLYLATFGSRTMMDRLIVLTVGDRGNFHAGLKALLDAGMISDHERAILQPIIEAGHAAAHRGWSPTLEHFGTILDTIEGLIHRLLVLPKLTEELEEAVPGRNVAMAGRATRPLTIETKIELAPPAVRAAYEELQNALVELGGDVSLHPQKHYMAFRRRRNFACVELFNKKKIVRAYVNVDPEEVDLTRAGLRDVRQIGHYGTGDLEVTLQSKRDVEKIVDLIRMAYAAS